MDHSGEIFAFVGVGEIDVIYNSRQDDRGGSRKGSKGNAVRARSCTMPRLPPQL
jgi:hypothetical protein